MTGWLDPRTLPHSRFLDRLGARRPAVSIIVAAADPRAAAMGALHGMAQASDGAIQLLVVPGGPSPAGATHVARRAIGRLLILLPRPADCADLPALAARFAAEPWCGVIGIAGTEGGLMIRENLWTALSGFEPAFAAWPWAARDLCQRARAIGYAAPDAACADDSPDARLYAARAALAPAPRAMRPIEAGPTIYTAITDCYDSLKPQPVDAMAGSDLIAFLDRGTTSALAGRHRGWRVATVDPPAAATHRGARFYKINAHLALPDAAYSLWIDASIGIVCPYPLARLAALFLAEHDLCVFRHHARGSVYEEAEACKALGRDRQDIIDAQMARYRADGLPPASGLIEAPILLRRHTAAMRAVNEAWWTELRNGSQRDQLSFNYVAWKTGFRYACFPMSVTTANGLFVKFRRFPPERPSRSPDAAVGENNGVS
jgi:hypothetical protein